MAFEIRTMSIRHYPGVLAVWQSCPEGVHISPTDTREGVRAYLRRNRGLSVVAVEGRQVVGALLAGHDGRRGLLHHLAVDPAHRGLGIAKALVDEALRRLVAAGIIRCWIVIMAGNAGGRTFWKQAGWQEQPDVVMGMKNLTGGAEASGYECARATRKRR